MLVWNDFQNDARVLKEAQTLSHAGNSVTVFAVHVPGQTLTRERLASGLHVRRIVLNPLCSLRAQPAQQRASNTRRYGGFSLIVSRLWGHLCMLWEVVRLRPDVVHAHDVNTLPTAWLAAILAGAKLVYDAHEISTNREGYAGFRKWVGLLEKALMPRADGTITTTEARAKFFARAYGIARPVVLQNRPRQQLPQASERIRHELGLTEAWPIVVYQGGLQQGRGLERLVRIAVQVPDTYFVLIGGGRLDGSLRSTVAELQLGGRVHFIPIVALAELPSYTASADIGVQPIENTCLNHYTTDSNKLFEYVQAGLPVIASDLPEIRRIVRRYDLGLLVPAGDGEALVDALRRMVSDVGLRQHHAKQARAAAAQLSWEVQENVLLELYRRILA